MDLATAEMVLTGLRDLFLLEPGVAYFNHGSFGACPREVFQVYQNWQLELERQPMHLLHRRRDSLLAEAREALAQEIGADGDDVVYMTNVTLALNVVAHSIELEPGDEVLTTDMEYGAMNNMWRYVCDRAGARYVCQTVARPFESFEQIVESIWSGVTDRTRVLFLSHITSGTSVILPVDELCRRARERGIISVIDGAHAVGQIPVDVDAIGADYYAANCHKWLMSPKGAGFLHARRDAQPRLKPLVVSQGIGELHDGRSRYLAQQEYQGTRDISGFLSVPAAIRFAHDHDWNRVRQACHEMVSYARRQLFDWSGIEAMAPDSPAWYSQMASLPLPAFEGINMHDRLLDEYGIEAVIGCRPGHSNGAIRLSIQGYNTREELDRLLDAIRTLIPVP